MYVIISTFLNAVVSLVFFKLTLTLSFLRTTKIVIKNSLSIQKLTCMQQLTKVVFVAAVY